MDIWKGISIAATGYVGWTLGGFILKFMVMILLVSAVLMPIDSCYKSITGKDLFSKQPLGSEFNPIKAPKVPQRKEASIPPPKVVDPQEVLRETRREAEKLKTWLIAMSPKVKRLRSQYIKFRKRVLSSEDSSLEELRELSSQCSHALEISLGSPSPTSLDFCKKVADEQLFTFLDWCKNYTENMETHCSRQLADDNWLSLLSP